MGDPWDYVTMYWVASALFKYKCHRCKNSNNFCYQKNTKFHIPCSRMIHNNTCVYNSSCRYWLYHNGQFYLKIFYNNSILFSFCCPGMIWDINRYQKQASCGVVMIYVSHNFSRRILRQLNNNIAQSNWNQYSVQSINPAWQTINVMFCRLLSNSELWKALVPDVLELKLLDYMGINNLIKNPNPSSLFRRTSARAFTSVILPKAIGLQSESGVFRITNGYGSFMGQLLLI